MWLVGVVIVGTLVLCTLPVVAFPERVARYRFRHAADSEPDRVAVTNVRLAGVGLLLFELAALASVLR